MKKVIILLTIVLLTGCHMGKNDVAYVENDNVSIQIATAAKKASNAIIELAEVEKVKTPTTVAPMVEDVPRLLRQKMSITWNGPIAPLAKKIAARAMYGFVEIGGQYPTPILVQIDAIEAPLIDILRSIGLQAGARANIIVDVENRNIEVHYVETQEVL